MIFEILSIRLLNWSVVAVSIFNTIALIWLGLTVLLNAERPRWGTYAVGIGLLGGGVFFAAHTAAIARDLPAIGRELAIWWRIVWVPFVAGPYLWYLVMAWFSGAVQQRTQRIALAGIGAVGAIALMLPVVANPLPDYSALRTPAQTIFSIGGIPVALLVYPVFSTLCIILAIVVLRRPGASDRFMGDLARLRARPWLMASSAVLLLVSLCVGAAAAWVLVGMNSGLVDILAYRTLVILHACDLLVSSLIAVAVVLMGKAIVSYEIFTGKSLPRGGLLRYWRNSLILAAGYGALLAWSLDLPVDPIYRLMLATVLMTFFYALLSWRSYAERERSMRRLRPFVASQHLYDQMTGPRSTSGALVGEPFRALCEDVIDAETAVLLPIGPLAPLVPPLRYGMGDAAGNPPELSAELIAQLAASDTLCEPVDPQQLGGAVWAVPLWSERGLIGVLLLGPKRGGMLYTQEEIEIARTAAERLVDTRASAELARRLMGLQRRSLAESQVADRRTRRVLHDDVLPQIHAAMIMLQSSAPGAERTTSDVVATLADAHRRIADLLHDMPDTAGADVARIGLVEALRMVTARELVGAFDQIEWRVDAIAEERARQIGPLAGEVLFYAAREAMRNAARHGRGDHAGAQLNLTISVSWRDEHDPAAGVTILVEDDGVGPGSATAGLGGSGRGLALHSTLLAVVGGSLTMERRQSGGTRVRLLLPPQLF